MVLKKMILVGLALLPVQLLCTENLEVVHSDAGRIAIAQKNIQSQFAAVTRRKVIGGLLVGSGLVAGGYYWYIQPEDEKTDHTCSGHCNHLPDFSSWGQVKKAVLPMLAVSLVYGAGNACQDAGLSAGKNIWKNWFDKNTVAARVCSNWYTSMSGLKAVVGLLPKYDAYKKLFYAAHNDAVFGLEQMIALVIVSPQMKHRSVIASMLNELQVLFDRQATTLVDVWGDHGLEETMRDIFKLSFELSGLLEEQNYA